jgi:hypothetical protein
VATAARLTTTITDTRTPAAAWSGTHVGVVYIEASTSGTFVSNLLLALLNPDGTRAVPTDLALTTFTPGTGEVTAADIVWTGTEFGVLWLQKIGSVSHHLIQRISAAGTPLAPPFDITQNTPPPTLFAVQTELSWNSVYGGYAIGGANGNVGLQRLGPIGETPEPINALTVGASDGAFAVSPAGEWAYLSKVSSSARLSLFNSDGSHTKTDGTFGSSVATDSTHVLHDGVAWLSAWRSSNSLWINRGDQSNSPAVNVAASATPNNIRFARAGNVVELLWSEPNDIRLKRLSVPPTLTATLPQLGGITTVLATQNAITTDAVHTGSGALLVVWSDNRWGALELYAAPVDFSSCP